MGECWLADPTQRQTGERNSHLRRRKVGIEIAGHLAGDLGATIPVADERIELCSSYFDEGELSGDEKTVDRNQQEAEDKSPTWW